MSNEQLHLLLRPMILVPGVRRLKVTRPKPVTKVKVLLRDMTWDLFQKACAVETDLTTKYPGLALDFDYEPYEPQMDGAETALIWIDEGGAL